VKVLIAAMLEYAVDAALEYRERAFYGVRVDSTFAIIDVLANAVGREAAIHSRQLDTSLAPSKTTYLLAFNDAPFALSRN
jgi:hypothetical protein